MADTLRFVDYEWSVTGGSSGNILLDINDGTDYCLDEIEFPPPKPRYEWRDPAHGDGREVSRYKFENREITLKMHIYGTDEADLSTNARNLWEQFLVDNPILEWIVDGWTDPLYIDLVAPPEEIVPEDWFVSAIRGYDKLFTISNLEFTLEAKPFLRGPREEVVVAEALGLNDSFEDWTGANVDHWTITVANAGTVTQDAANFFDGANAVRLTTTAAGSDIAAITDTAYIAVDSTKHYNVRFCTKKISGTAAIDVDVGCYDVLGNLLGTLNMLVADNVSGSWEDPVELGGVASSQGVIHPAGSGDPFAFPLGTTQIKRTIRNDSAVASAVAVDRAWFGCSEMFERLGYIGAGAMVATEENRYENPAVVTLPALKGDVPTPIKLAVWQPEYTGANHYLAYSHSGANKGYLFKPTNAAATTYSIGFIDQYYKPPTANQWTFPYIPVEGNEGRYYPVVRFYGDTIPYTYILAIGVVVRTISTSTQIFSGNYPTVNFTTAGLAYWRLSGFSSAFEPFSIIDILPYGTPPGIDKSDLEFSIKITEFSPSGNEYLDYAMLIPVENGFQRCLIPGDNTAFGYYLDDNSYRYIDGVTMADTHTLFKSDDTDEVVDLPLYVNPATENKIAFMLTDVLGGGSFNTMGHPYVEPNVSVFYDPMYLLVPEE